MLLINLIGQIAGNRTGYGTYTQGFWQALTRMQDADVQCMFTDFRKPGEIEKNAAICSKFPGRVVNIWLQIGPGQEVLAHFPGERVAYTMFETDVLPDGWVTGLTQADQVWTTSQWGRQVMIDSGLPARSTHVVPGGIDRVRFTPWGPGLPQLKSNAFKFLMVGTYETRKGYAELFRAFRQAFDERTDVELLIKCQFLPDAAKREKLRARISAHAPRQLRVVEGRLNDATMAALYRSCDCFVFPSRGEGCGLPLIEAMACGLPVISTCCSGHSQVLDRFAGRYLRIDTIQKSAQAPDFLRWYRWSEGAGSWYEPDIDSLARLMQQAASRHFPLDPVATAMNVRQLFSWESSVDVAMRILLLGGEQDP